MQIVLRNQLTVLRIQSFHFCHMMLDVKLYLCKKHLSLYTETVNPELFALGQLTICYGPL